jgi:hypothetical protein
MPEIKQQPFFHVSLNPPELRSLSMRGADSLAGG